MKRLAASLMGLAMLACGPALAGSPTPATPKAPAAQKAAPAMSAAEREAKARNYFTDTTLVNHDGRKLRFYSDVLKDQVVLINFVFTDCGDACPLITHKLRTARKSLGDDARGIRYVSISIDPANDTPQSLAKFARKHEAIDPQWLWMTGEPKSVEAISKRLGAYTENKEEHFTGLLIGNLRTDRWRKVRPDTPAEGIAALLREMGGLDVAASSK